jgi:hypothetical protein
MAFAFVLQTPDLDQPVAAFNARLEAGGIAPGIRIPQCPPSRPPNPRAVCCERYLVMEGAEVRGSYTLQLHPFWVAGCERQAANLQLPISEGIVNRRYTTVALSMFRHLQTTYPLLYGIGMGGVESPLARLQRSLGWRVGTAPFFFRVVRPRRFVREIGPLRRRTAVGRMARIAAALGAGGIVRLAQWRPGPRALPAEAVSDWGEWADAVWEAARADCTFAAVRDSSTLPTLHVARPQSRSIRLGNAGWLVLQVTDMHESPYFGNLRVGTLVDCLANPGLERRAVRTAIGLLEDEGVDLILTNQSHPRWGAALRSEGFWSAASNYVFSESVPLATLNTGWAHVNRADGDGRYNL